METPSDLVTTKYDFSVTKISFDFFQKILKDIVKDLESHEIWVDYYGLKYMPRKWRSGYLK